MADEGYVNEGTDRRARGIIGNLLASVQRDNSFKSPTEPALVWHESYKPNWFSRLIGYRQMDTWEYRSQPGDKPYHVIFYYRADGTIDTYRFGYRYDKFWGDANLPEGSYNPDPDIVGGYIYDVIIKIQRDPNNLPAHY